MIHSLFTIAVSYINPGCDKGLSEKLSVLFLKAESENSKRKKKLTTTKSHKNQNTVSCGAQEPEKGELFILEDQMALSSK